MNQQYLLKRAYQEACNSNDKSTKHGALLINNNGHILITASNSMSLNMVNDSRNHERPRKYKITEHAERAAIYKAAKVGLSTNCLILVCPLAACSDCARAIVLAGIKLVISHKRAFDKLPEYWRKEMSIGAEIFENGGVEHQMFDGKIGSVKNLCDGKIWNP